MSRAVLCLLAGLMALPALAQDDDTCFHLDSNTVFCGKDQGWKRLDAQPVPGNPVAVLINLGHQLDLMHRVQRLADQGRTVIAAIHDLELAARFADRILMLAEGRLVADGAPETVLTPARLNEVFGVDAEVDVDETGLRIRYLAAIV